MTSASRTGVRLMPRLRASSSSFNLCPGSSVPSTIAFRSSSVATSLAFRTRGSGRSTRLSIQYAILPTALECLQMVLPRTLTAKILDDHLAGESDGEIDLRVGQVLIEDATGTMACLQFERLGVDRIQVPLAVSYVDHNVVQFDERNPDDHVYLRSCANRYGLLYSRPGNGISHYLHLERFARPGEVLVGADSHTTMAGGLGMLAIGAG